MKEASLKTRLTNYLQRKGDWVASGHLQELAQQNGYWSPQNTGRRLRELENEGIVEVDYRKGHAWYRAKQNKRMKDIQGYESLYAITEDGKVWSYPKRNGYGEHHGKFISQGFNGNYYHVTLYKEGQGKTFHIHRLLAEHFIPNPKNLPQVNHKNGIKTDNKIKNLEWVSHLENMKHASENGLFPTGDDHWTRKPKVEIKIINGTPIAVFA